MTNITDFSVKTDGSSYSKLLVVLLPMLMLFTTSMVSNQYVYPQDNSSNMTTPATIEELNTEEFSQIVITSSQINELNSTINNAIKATEQDNMTEVLLELKILQNQLDLINNP
jgi:cob(I)alamin adenosyltransferase